MCDSGPGLEPRSLDRLFDAFYLYDKAARPGPGDQLQDYRGARRPAVGDSLGKGGYRGRR
jgi:hypothetical protein